VCLIYFSLFAALPARERVTDLSGGTGRTDLWTVGWRMVQDRPLLGVGVGNFQNASIHYLLRPGAIQRDDLIITTPKQAHNTELEFLAETGIPGLAFFLGIVAASLASLMAAARAFERAGDREMGVLSRALFVGVSGYLVAGVFITTGYSKLLWLLLALGPAMFAVARRAASSSR
jgi:O-antigen ligase